MLPRSYYTEEDARKRQIDTLKVFNEHVTEVAEDSEYRVDFTIDGRSMSLTVLLPPEYPNEQPKIFVNPAVSHPWIPDDTNEVVGAPGLLNYSVHSDLGRIVQAIIRELQRRLPTLEVGQRRLPTLEDVHRRLPTLEDVQRRLPTLEDVQHQPSAMSMMYPELSELTVSELTHILHNTDLQDRLLESNPQLTQLDVETEEVLASIEEIAQDNLDKQKTLDDLKTDIIERISTTVQMKMNYEELNRKHHQLAETYDPHRIRDRLKEAALKADEDAESIAEQFLLGTIPVDTFVSRYAEKRALGQARRAREERLAHQLTQLDKATT